MPGQAEAMSNFALLVICLAAGVLLRRTGRVGEHAHQALNAVIIHLALPAVTVPSGAATAAGVVGSPSAKVGATVTGELKDPPAGRDADWTTASVPSYRIHTTVIVPFGATAAA